MELYTLNINVNKQRLSFGENKPDIFSGDQSIDFVEFTFEDDMWNFPNIWAIFSRFKGTSYQVSLEDNKVMIPAEVMQNRGYVYIGLMATDGENVQTSNVLQYSIGQGSTNVDAITPSASIYEQFLADLDAYQTAVADLDDIESRITTAEGNVSMIEQAVTDLNEQLGDIYVDISTINGQITTIQNNIGTAQSDIVSIQNGINALNGQVAGLDTAVGTLSNRVTALQSSVTSLEGRLTTVGNTLTDFEGRLTTAGTTLTNLEGSISDAENDIQTVQGDIETIQSDIEDIQTAIEQNNVVTDVTAEGISLVDNHIADLSFMCVTDTASGDVASFPDGSGVAMKKAEVSLEPIQDLHGYDKPWAAGAGEQLIPYPYSSTGSSTINGITFNVLDEGKISVVGTATANAQIDLCTSAYSTMLKLKAGKSYALSINNSSCMAVIVVYTAQGASYLEKITTASNTFSLPNDGLDYRARILLRVTSGTTISTPINIALKLQEGTSATSWTPYSNICPIDGYEDVGVSVRGFNQFDKDTMTVDGAYINNNTGVAVANQDYKCTDFIKVVGGATYYVKTEQTNAGWGAWYDADKNYVSGTTGWINNISTAPANAVYGRFTIASAQGGNPDTLCINLSDPSRNGTYEPYAGTDYTTTLGRTVYGGTVDLASGVLTVDRAIVDLGSLNWINHSSGVFWAIVNGKKKGVSNIVCSQYETSQLAGVGNLQNNQIVGENGGLAVYIKDTRFTTDAAAFKTAMNGVQLVYELATPQTYQLTPQQIQTLIGTNNVWSEDGAIEVEYIANLKDYIDKKINA